MPAICLKSLRGNVARAPDLTDGLSPITIPTYFGRTVPPSRSARQQFLVEGTVEITLRSFHVCWWCVKYGILVAFAAAAGAGLYYYNHVNDEIRQYVLAKLAGHYAGLKVEVRSALLVDGEGIEIRGVTISDPQFTGAAAELAYFDEIVLFCRTELGEFVAGQPHIERVRIRRPRIRATRLPDGRWSAGRLLPCPKFGKHRIETAIENGLVELVDAVRPNAPTFTLREVNLELHPITDESEDGDEPIQFEGGFSGDYVHRVNLAGRIEPAGAGFRIDEATIERLDLWPEFCASLPVDIAAHMAPLASLRASCGLRKLSLAYQPNANPAWIFSVDGLLTEGRYDDARLPQALTELAADFHADNRGLLIRELTGRFGQSSFRCVGELHGYSPGVPLFLELKAEQLMIGRNWEAMLDEEMLANWRKFQPAGEIDLNLTLRFDGRTWQPEVKVDCRNVSFTYYKFPYRVDRSRGTVFLIGNRLSLDLAAQAAGREIKIRGEIDDPGPNFTGVVAISGNDLAVEPKIIDALQPKPREIVTSLNPGGTFDFYTEIRRDDARDPRPHQTLRLNLKHGSVRYDKFRYPIGNIQGSVQMQDGEWWSDDLEGSNDSGRIFCNARLEPAVEGSLLTLHFRGQDIVLEDELRDALPAQVQKVWRDVRPRGSLDLRADVRYVAGSKKPDIVVRVDRLDENASIEPVQFPLRMEQLRGVQGRPVFVYDSQAGRVDFTQLRATHGRTALSATGYCSFNEQGNWLLSFQRLSADGVRNDGDLLAALPAGLKRVADQLRPSGVLNLDGSCDFAPSGIPEQPLWARWNMDVNVQQTSLNCGVLLENVSGGVHLEGEHDGRRLRSAGELSIDSFTFKDLQFTEFRGPLWIDDKQLVLGTRADRPQPGRTPRRMTAKLYGGTVLADLWVGFGDTPSYLLQTTLTDGELERFAREQLAGKQRLKGKVGAGLVLRGAGTSIHQMEGHGQMWLRDADIYELPFMVQLLKILSIRPPDKTGFTTSDTEFDIAGEHILLKRLEFSGDAISLLGSGEMNLNCDVQATLSAIVGRSDWQLPVFKSVMGQASQQIMEIHVDGNLADPRIRREAFPVINQALQQLQAEMQPRVQPLPQEPSPQAAKPGPGRR